MSEYTAATYGERIAGIYDEWYGDCNPAMFDRLAELAGPGPALELGIGTGRVALLLQQRGVDVRGVDASEAMVVRLREKPEGATIPVVIGSFAELPDDPRIAGPFTLAYVVFNTLFALLTQEEQVQCFQGVAQRLKPGGVFLLEAFVPDLTRFQRDQTVQATRVTTDGVTLDISRHDPVTQQITSQHVVLAEAGVRLYPVQIRYVWPSEMDLMARLAGLSLRERWGDWNRAPF